MASADSKSHSGRMTVDQLERLTPPIGGHFELFQGSLLTVACPRWDHYVCQEKIRAALAAAAGSRGFVGAEMPFRPVPEHNFLRADVAFLSPERARVTLPREHLAGAPELIVEILTPPSRPARVQPRKQLCLENGCQEFWIVTLEACTVEVSTANGTSRIFTIDDRISVALFGGAEIPVAAFFS